MLVTVLIGFRSFRPDIRATCFSRRYGMDVQTLSSRRILDCILVDLARSNVDNPYGLAVDIPRLQQLSKATRLDGHGESRSRARTR